jgi:hypothetical protein
MAPKSMYVVHILLSLLPVQIKPAHNSKFCDMADPIKIRRVIDTRPSEKHRCLQLEASDILRTLFPGSFHLF